VWHAATAASVERATAIRRYFKDARRVFRGFALRGVVKGLPSPVQVPGRWLLSKLFALTQMTVHRYMGVLGRKMKRYQGNEVEQNDAGFVEGDPREVHCIELFDLDLQPARVQPVKPIVGKRDHCHPAYQQEIVDKDAPQQHILDLIHCHGRSSTKRQAPLELWGRSANACKWTYPSHRSRRSSPKI
jgi:hypothetical protein